jgi:hypothetical protein
VIPQDDVSAAAWTWAELNLPTYLLTHSVRAYAWGAAIADGEGWGFDHRILWTAALFHDVGLTRIPRNVRCFEFEGAEIARRFLRRHGLPADAADRAAKAIVDHMAPGVTLADGVESVLLDRATGLDVRGAEFHLVDGVRDAVMQDAPRGAFDRLFLDAVSRELDRRTDCQSRRLLRDGDLAGSMVRSPWAITSGRA